MEIGSELLGVTEWLPATVPGGVHDDLYRSGWIEHPWFEQNSLACEWVENRWWVYRTTIDEIHLGENESAELVFEGIDYEALIYVNDQLLGEHKGMFHEAVFDISGRCRSEGPLVLSVIVKHAPDEMAQIGRTSETHTQKSRFNYKWDFSTRLVNIGIWGDVYIRIADSCTLEDTHVIAEPTLDTAQGIVRVSAAIRNAAIKEEETKARYERLSLHVQVFDPEGNECACNHVDVSAAGHTELELEVAKPELWFPNGYGEQPLYEVTVQIRDGERCLDKQSLLTGFRTLRYERNEGSPQEALPYTFVVNGVKVYIQGVNLTPLDHLYGNVLPEQYAYMVEMMKRGGVNMVRVWGGGLIEKEEFYDLCDRNGIMIWQEFIQSSSGVDNMPSKQPEYLRLLKLSAVSALKRKRSHVSLTVWSGGNELMEAPNKPCTYEDENIAMLKELVERYDSQRLFLPTSASGPVEFITREKGVSHDVHGFWKYQGNPDHYSLYGDADHLFHSEFGVDGLSSAKSIRKFVGADNQSPASMKDNLVWRHHGEWWDTLERDEALFGSMKTLESFSDASQWMQAEGLRFILEANRRRQFRNSGSMIWQLNEPYPNISCTSLIDYYGEAKMAYYWMRQAFLPAAASLDYRKLDYGIGEVLDAPVFVVGRGGTQTAVLAEAYGSDGQLRWSKTFHSGLDEEGRSRLAGRLHLPITEELRGLFMIRLTLSQSGNGHASDGSQADYFFSAGRDGEEPVYAGAVSLRGAVLQVSGVGRWEPEEPAELVINASGTATLGLSSLRRSYIVENTGQALALHVRCEETTNGYWLAASEQFFTLLPGERKEVEVSCFRKKCGGLLAEDKSAASLPPDLIFRCFGQDTDGYEERERHSINEKEGAKVHV
ncbi:hypothetical protein M6D81_21820 [Paenibacillus sp. J5C_2022]|uniref:glycoside hydrolase family 2 protein n=1 Tax=Paenibacillus sp. J5C2022 TaxID=2977129 RepID=UPI0021D2F585|nr:glycoside hydrolase family 2 TIM barrel-domain containing protein [Paenibacillus sp. J5C2022]MCU6711336.1 hypothetical protein [Paenibacillus sp. J5C2022]